MSLFAIAFILIIAAGAGAGLVFIGVLIQWSLRKALPSRPSHLEIESAPQVEPLPALAPAPTPELAEPVAVAEPEPEQYVAPPTAVREPVRIGLGLRKTRENFLARIRAALTGSAKMRRMRERLHPVGRPMRIHD
ncbi:MAG TPA: hypothetical protein VIW95_01150, partial [Candidatus Binatus sp.]